MEKNLNEIIQKANETQKAINRMESENRSRMCEVIVSILKENGGKLTADDWEEVLDENLEITFISQDGTYFNDFCEVYCVEIVEDFDGKPTFTINCYDVDKLYEYSLSYDNVCQIFEGLSEYWQKTQR